MSFINNLLKSIEGTLSNATGLQSKGVNADSFKPGDIVLEDITLQSSNRDRAFPLMDHAKLINIFESVMSPIICAEIDVADAIGLKQNFPILGGEYITIKFKTPGAKSSTSYTFIVRSVSDVKVHTNNKMVVYKLKCISSEVLRNADRHITRTVDGNLSDSIRNILEDDVGTNKKVRIDISQGIEKHSITRMHPFVGIDYLRQRSTSNKDKSSSFVFFENKDGFNFTTVETLIKDGKSNIGDKKFFYDMNRNTNISNINWRDILAYNQIVFNDVVEQTQSGGFNTKVKSLNLITGEYKEVKYDDSKGADKFEMMDSKGKPSKSSTTIQNLSKNTPVSKIIPINTDISNEDITEKLANVQAFTQKLIQNITQIHIYGDSSLTVGQMIECTFPSAQGTDDDTGVSRLDSGNYLITKLRHIIVNDDRPQHTISLETVKSGILS